MDQLIDASLSHTHYWCEEGMLKVLAIICRRDPGKMCNNYCYTYLTEDQHPPSNLLAYSTIQCSTIEIMI